MFLPFSSSILNANGQFSLDSTSNNNDAKLFTGNALSFDGVNDYVDVGNPNISLKTLVFWINLDSTTEQVINLTSSQSVLISSGTITLNGTWSGSVIYVNNVATSTISASNYNRVVITTTSAINVDDLEFGRIGSDYGAFKMSDVQIWNSTWSLTDVANDYGNPNQLVSSVSISNLKGWFALTEGSGNLAIDSATELGSDLVTNGDFASDSNWIKGTGWTISGGSANGSSTTGDLYQENVVESGKYYQVTFTISNYSAGSVRVELPNNSSAGTERSANGTYTEIILSSGTILLFDARTSFTGSIDNVSVKEVSVGTINGATYDDEQSSILQLGMINWSNGSGVFLPSSPTNSSQDILGNAVRERLNSLNLTGTGYAEVDDSASISPTSAITIQCWIKSNTENSKGLVAKWKSPSTDYMLFKVSNLFRIYIGNEQLSSAVIPQTGWLNIAGSYDGSTMKTFVNGQPSTSKSFSGTINDGNLPLEIGRYNNSSSTSYSERIDDVKIYNRALSDAEILKNYNAGLPAHQDS